VAVASAGPYANLHLAPDRQPHQHPTTLFLQAGCPSCRPTNSVKALKEQPDTSGIGENRRLSTTTSIYLENGRAGEQVTLKTGWPIYKTSVIQMILARELKQRFQ